MRTFGGFPLMTVTEFEERLREVLREPSPKDAFYKMCDLYLIASEKKREEIRANFGYNRSWEAPNFRTLVAHLPNEPDRETRIRASLVALSFLDGETRDYLSQACVIYHSIKAIGKDADGWFRYFSDISSAFAASLLFNIASRPPENRSLEAFLWESEVTEQGLIYKNKPH